MWQPYSSIRVYSSNIKILSLFHDKYIRQCIKLHHFSTPSIFVNIKKSVTYPWHMFVNTNVCHSLWRVYLSNNKFCHFTMQVYLLVQKILSFFMTSIFLKRDDYIRQFTYFWLFSMTRIGAITFIWTCWIKIKNQNFIKLKS